MTNQIKEKIYCIEDAIWAESDHQHNNFANCTSLMDFNAVNNHLKPLCDQQK